MYYGARYYDPALSRFITPDSLYDRGPQGLNRYSYALNNPIRYNDPSGHFSLGSMFGNWEWPGAELVGAKMQAEAQGAAEAVTNQITPPEQDTGVLEGSVPIWGDAKDSYLAMKEGKVFYAALYGAMAVNDVVDGGGSPEDFAKAGIRGGEKILERVASKKIQTITTRGIGEQLDYLLKNIPGLTKEQATYLLENAYKRDSTVVFGGSRVRGNYRPNSDLDVGFGNLSKRQAQRVVHGANKQPGLLLEDRIKIVPGSSTTNIPPIVSPEEFFQRSGKRAPSDPIQGVYSPSGSITVSPNGTITIIPLGGNS